LFIPFGEFRFPREHLLMDSINCLQERFLTFSEDALFSLGLFLDKLWNVYFVKFTKKK